MTAAARSEDPAAWDLRILDGPCTAQALRELCAFVEELIGDDIEVPPCWYVHPWLRARLLAILWWRRRTYTTDPIAAAQWWSQALGPLQRDWEPLFRHHGRHPCADDPYGAAVAMPALETVMSALVQEADERAV